MIPTPLGRFLSTLTLTLLLAPAASARDIPVAPGDAIPQILRDAAPGDRLVLQNGSYGALKLYKKRFDHTVEIVAANPGRAVFREINILSSRNLTLRGLAVWPDQPDHDTRVLVQVDKASADIRLEGLDLRGNETAPETYMRWSKQDWASTWKVSGVMLDGPRSALIGSRLAGVAFGVTATADHAEIRDNLITGFSGDAMRAIGNHARVTGNRVQDCVKVNDNHDDGFQSWAPKDKKGKRQPLRDLVLRNNVIVEWTGPRDAPLRCTLQGIGMFDGPYMGVEVDNNIVAVSAYHGISLYGAQGAHVIRNTVVTTFGTPGKSPWIMVRESKDGGIKPLGAVILGNVAMGYKGMKVSQRDNVVARYPARLFRDIAGQDYRPSPDGQIGNRPFGAVPRQ